MHKPLVLVDGSSYLYRAFHALPPLTNSKGEPTGAIYGTVNMLKKLLTDYDSQQIVVVFDAKGKTFRHDIYHKYKATRPPMSPELRSQIAPLHDIVRALGFPLIIEEGVEADDVIGTLAVQASQMGQSVVIATGDKDMAQLVNEKISLINTMNSQVLDIAGVTTKFGVPPELIIDYLALIGDKVDNIPGIEKVGPKTALKWLQAYGDLDSIVAHADEIKGKVGENLRAGLANIPLAKQLLTIKCDLSLEFSSADLTIKSVDTKQLVELYKRFEFKTWLTQLLDDQTPQASVQYECINAPATLAVWVNKVKQKKLMAFDTETTSLNVIDARVVGVSIAVEPMQAAYIPFGHVYDGVPTQLSENEVWTALKPLLEDPTIEIIGQNLKYDMNVLKNHGINLAGVRFDTMLESYILDSTATRHDMKSLALAYLGRTTIAYEDVAGKGKKQQCFSSIALDKATEYAAEDADVTWQLHQTLWPKLMAQAEPRKLFDELEIPLVSVLAAMERQGVLIDPELLAQQSVELQQRLQVLEQEAHRLAGNTFNLASPKQLREILYEQNGLPILQKTPTGQASTAEPVLQELALNFPLPKLILEYRSLAKLKSTYTDRLPEQINAQTGRVHSSYHQAIAATGRLSSSDPNLQNIPVRTEEGRRIRQAFIAPSNYCIMAADYSQIELRIMAHLSQDKGLLTAFANNLDVHRATAAEVFGVSFDKVTKEQRRSAKAINFGLMYGMSAYGLSRQLDIEPGAAKTYMEVYFKRYPGVADYMEQTRVLAREQGYVSTLMGRRLYLPDINAKRMPVRKAAERAAINAPLQGTAADIIKRAMIDIDTWIRTEQASVHMIMQVHDELVFEVPLGLVDVVKSEVNQRMMQAANLRVPLLVAISVGPNWDEAHS